MNTEPFEFTFENLLFTKADVWNSQLASSLDMTVESLREIIMLRNLSVVSDNISAKIVSSEIADSYNNMYNSLGATEAFHSFVLKFNEEKLDPLAITLTGKIVIGVDLSVSVLHNSYFNNCIFYKCNFTRIAFENSVFNGCVFNNCNIENSDFSNATIYKSRFYECLLNESVFDYANIIDSMFVVCKMSYTHMMNASLTSTGFIDSVLSNSNFKDLKMVMSSFSNCDLSKSLFRRASIIDAIFIRTDFRDCDISQILISGVTTTCCDYDAENAELFIISKGMHSPSTYEWDEPEDVDDEDEEEVEY